MYRLNLNSCPKISDAGVEVLAMTCTGILSISLVKNTKITDRAVISLLSHCKLLSALDVRGCSSLSLSVPTLSKAVLSKRTVHISWPDHVLTTPSSVLSTTPAFDRNTLPKPDFSQSANIAPTKTTLDNSQKPLLRSNSATKV